MKGTRPSWLQSYTFLLTLTTARGWHLPQLDDNSTLLHGDFEEVYANPPLGYPKQNISMQAKKFIKADLSIMFS